jgi:peptidyl-prolyl cis-trans isomerase-like protein 2
MGKTQHGKDKMYITQKEWADQHGVRKSEGSSGLKRLPFHCCALSLTEFTHPVMTPDGYVFDLSSIVPFIRKYHINPTTGEALSGKDLIKLTFEKNTDGQYCCPSTGKVFTEHTKIAAIKTTGHVFSWDAINTLCIRPKNFRDLLNDEPFTKEGMHALTCLCA